MCCCNLAVGRTMAEWTEWLSWITNTRLSFLTNSIPHFIITLTWFIFTPRTIFTILAQTVSLTLLSSPTQDQTIQSVKTFLLFLMKTMVMHCMHRPGRSHMAWLNERCTRQLSSTKTRFCTATMRIGFTSRDEVTQLKMLGSSTDNTRQYYPFPRHKNHCPFRLGGHVSQDAGSQRGGFLDSPLWTVLPGTCIFVRDSIGPDLFCSSS